MLPTFAICLFKRRHIISFSFSVKRQGICCKLVTSGIRGHKCNQTNLSFLRYVDYFFSAATADFWIIFQYLLLYYNDWSTIMLLQIQLHAVNSKSDAVHSLNCKETDSNWIIGICRIFICRHQGFFKVKSSMRRFHNNVHKQLDGYINNHNPSCSTEDFTIRN